MRRIGARVGLNGDGRAALPGEWSGDAGYRNDAGGPLIFSINHADLNPRRFYEDDHVGYEDFFNAQSR